VEAGVGDLLRISEESKEVTYLADRTALNSLVAKDRDRTTCRSKVQFPGNAVKDLSVPVGEVVGKTVALLELAFTNNLYAA
jgi:hypothetical protein